jgi:hypothetical protein
VIGAKGTRAGKNLHAMALTRFNSAQQGKEMEGRALVRVCPCGGRGGGPVQCVVHGRRRGGGPAGVKRADAVACQ